jgi:pimeloyl-ACP methyl ester carboxylesterase
LQDTSISYFEWCKRNGWAFVHPDFRGWSNRPEAAGSSLVVRDILDAVKFALHEGCVDARRVYMVGSSGGGMMALLMAGIAPEFWAGVSAWVPVTDLGEWFLETQSREPGYTADLLSILGGNPATDKKAALEASKRSPLTYLPAAKGIPIDICGGITDGHTGSVPLTHSLRAFNVLAQPRGRISQPDIDFMVKNQEVPITLRYGGEDPAYGKKKVLLRRSSGNARITVFQGGHEIIYEAALNWLGGLAGPLP